MNVLGIETSCDETSVAVVRDDGCTLSNVVRTQAELHAPLGGVVPEIAARDHLRGLVPVCTTALKQAQNPPIDTIFVCAGPGLVPALLTGVSFAIGLSQAWRVPVFGVDHVLGHLASVGLSRLGEPARALHFPVIALAVSGGHTGIYHVRSGILQDITMLGATRDDAAGETLDKTAKLLGLGYPGGPLIEKHALNGRFDRFKLVRPLRNAGLEFSFSGLKTQVMTIVARGEVKTSQDAEDLCASIQHAVVEILVEKLFLAVRLHATERVAIVGGVSANLLLRDRATDLAARHGIELLLPPLWATGDNGAMIALAGINQSADPGPLAVAGRGPLSKPRRPKAADKT